MKGFLSVRQIWTFLRQNQPRRSRLADGQLENRFFLSSDTATFSLVVELYVHFSCAEENFAENFISLSEFLNYTYFKYANKLTTKSIFPFYFFFCRSKFTHTRLKWDAIEEICQRISSFFLFLLHVFDKFSPKSNTIINQLTRWKTMQLCVMKKNDYDFIISFRVFAHILHLLKGNWGKGRIIILKSTRSELYTNSFFFLREKENFFFCGLKKKENFLSNNFFTTKLSLWTECQRELKAKQPQLQAARIHFKWKIKWKNPF